LFKVTTLPFIYYGQIMYLTKFITPLIDYTEPETERSWSSLNFHDIEKRFE